MTRFPILGLDMHTEWPGLVAWTLARGAIPEHADPFQKLLAMKLSWDLDRNPAFPEPDAEARRIAAELTEPVIARVA